MEYSGAFKSSDPRSFCIYLQVRMKLEQILQSGPASYAVAKALTPLPRGRHRRIYFSIVSGMDYFFPDRVFLVAQAGFEFLILLLQSLGPGVTACASWAGCCTFCRQEKSGFLTERASSQSVMDAIALSRTSER